MVQRRLSAVPALNRHYISTHLGTKGVVFRYGALIELLLDDPPSPQPNSTTATHGGGGGVCDVQIPEISAIYILNV